MKTQTGGGTPPPPKARTLAERVYRFGAPASLRLGKGRRAAPPIPPGGTASDEDVRRAEQEGQEGSGGNAAPPRPAPTKPSPGVRARGLGNG